MARQKAADAGQFRPLRQQRPLYEQLAAVIREKIAAGDLAAGARLPAEKELAAQLGVGRPSLREALKILQAIGMLSIQHGSGVYVRPSVVEEVTAGLNATPSPPADRLRDLFELRLALECQSASWAAQRATETDIAALRGLVRQMTALVEKGEADDRTTLLDGLAELDKAFHHQLTTSTGNGALIGLAGTIVQMLAETRAYSLAIPGRPVQSVYDHRRILRAVEARAPLAAARAMFAHIAGIERRVMGSPEGDGAVRRPAAAGSLVILHDREAGKG